MPERHSVRQHHTAIAFASKSLTGTEHRYSNIRREALCIMHGLKKYISLLFSEGSLSNYQS